MCLKKSGFCAFNIQPLRLCMIILNLNIKSFYFTFNDIIIYELPHCCVRYDHLLCICVQLHICLDQTHSKYLSIIQPKSKTINNDRQMSNINRNRYNCITTHYVMIRARDMRALNKLKNSMH